MAIEVANSWAIEVLFCTSTACFFKRGDETWRWNIDEGRFGFYRREDDEEGKRYDHKNLSITLGMALVAAISSWRNQAAPPPPPGTPPPAVPPPACPPVGPDPDDSAGPTPPGMPPPDDPSKMAPIDRVDVVIVNDQRGVEGMPDWQADRTKTGKVTW